MSSIVRTSLYSIVIVSAFFSFVLASAFIGRTNDDFGSYNESSAAVLAASLLILLTLPLLHFLFHRRRAQNIIASVLIELVVLSILWIIMLGSAAAMSDQFQGVNGCDLSLCDLSRAVQAFAWISWIALTLLLAIVVVTVILSARRSQESFWMKPLDHSQVRFGRRANEVHSEGKTQPSATHAEVLDKSSTAPAMTNV
ncbi:hypothetical protein JCM16303_002904 [Sporobolomyces ruberrimus]